MVFVALLMPMCREVVPTGTVGHVWLHTVVSITETVLSTWFVSYSVLVFGFSSTSTGPAPTVVVGSNFVHPEVWVALHLDASSTHTSLVSWLVGYSVCVVGSRSMKTELNPIASAGKMF